MQSWELFGYDFMIDEDFKIYLIEVNTNPCLDTTCPLLARIISNVLDTSMRISLDPVFPPPLNQDGSFAKKSNAGGGGVEILGEIKLDLVFDEAIEAE